MKNKCMILLLFCSLVLGLQAAQAQEPQPALISAVSAEEPAGVTVADGMVYIPAGSFTMGSDLPNALEDSKPAHLVTLKGYWIDLHTVTNAEYAACVAAGICVAPRDSSSATRADYFTNPDYADYPVIHVDWNQANSYCLWKSKRLPTEAEWERAARGEDGRLYPWGNELPEVLPMAVNRHEGGDTVPVESFPEGVSPYGLYNMEGNVWEWTADQYDENFYLSGSSENPKAVTGGSDYVIRGFSWSYPFSRYEITIRNSFSLVNHSYDIGFRCAKD